MKRDSRFVTRPEGGGVVHLTIDGAAFTAQPGDTVAAALLADSGTATRHSLTGAPRAPYCMMGVCFECLIEVDGLPNVQGCMTLVRDGMRLRRAQGLRQLRQMAPAGSDDG